MQAATLVQLAITALLAASLPLALVWMSSDANKYRKLVWVTVFFTFDLIVFGAFTRLTDSGLGCPDWPGCYGLANPFQAHEQISAAQTLMPGGPVSVIKAWIEMIHRYLAMGIGVLILTLMAKAWLEWRRSRAAAFAPAVPTLLFLFVCLQGAFGAWTVTQKLQPVIVTVHLLLGMGLLALLTWLGAREDHLLKPPKLFEQSGSRQPGSDGSSGGKGGNGGTGAALNTLLTLHTLRALALMSAALLLLQIALGGWVSTNYATLACLDYPLCGGQLVPPMDFEHGFALWRALGKTAAGHYLPFSALTAIHWVHRNFALLVAVGIGWTVWRARAVPALRGTARNIAIVLGLQFASGLATVFLNFPLAIAVLHNAGAALMVLLVTMLNYRVKVELDSARRTGTRSPAPAPALAQTPARSARKISTQNKHAK
ncbi:MAG: COX15/CtaA family protein [Massilia sp.]|nr:COX15/CtaA family protein [Massilia sp.]